MRILNLILILLLMQAGCSESNKKKVVKIPNYTGRLVPFYDNGKYVYRDSIGKETIINEQFDFADFFFDDGAVVEDNGYYFIINRNGESISSKYNMIFDPINGYRRVVKDGLYGFIKTNGVEVVECRFTMAFDISNDVAYVVDDDINGFIDSIGNAVLPLRYDTNYPYYAQQMISNDICKIESGGKIGYISLDGEEVITPQYEDGTTFKNGITYVMSDLKYGALNTNGDTIFPFEIDYTLGFYSNKSPVRIGEQWYIQKTDGSIDRSKSFDLIIPNEFNENLVVKKSGKWGLVNKDLEPLLECEYQFIDCLDENFYALKQGNMWGAYYIKDKVFIKPEYKSVKRGDGEFVLVKLKKKWIACNSRGKLMINPN